MDRFKTVNLRIELTDSSISPAQSRVPEADHGVPKSFAEWLARPCQTITSGPESEQGIFVGMTKECQVRVLHEP
jgi:hypothetical protein